MSDVSFGPVLCKECGAALSEQMGLPEDQRTPCPVCGSKARRYAVAATAKTGVLPSMRATGLRAGMSKTKGWFKKIFGGQVPQRSRDNAVADVERTSDRNNDRYIEKVTMRDTGEVIHHTDERLSEHTGHGSDKRTR